MARQVDCRFKQEEDTRVVQSVEQSQKRDCSLVENVGLCIGETGEESQR